MPHPKPVAPRPEPVAPRPKLVAPRIVDLRHTSAFRLTAGLTGVFIVAVGALLWLFYTLTMDEFTRRIDQTVVGKAHMLAETTAMDHLAPITTAMHDSTSGLEAIAVFDPQGHLILGDPALSRPFPMGRVFERSRGPRGAPVRALALPTADHMTVVVSRDVSPIVDLRARMLTITLVSGAGAVVFALLAGIALSRGPIARIRRFQSVATRIAMGELQLRLAVTPRSDEFDMIAAIINTMVEEIERLLRQVKGATDAIAHDLRTPLSHVRTRLERLALLPGIADAPDSEAAKLLAGARDELDAALDRFRALLRISELEASSRNAEFAPLDPLEMVEGVAELYEPLAEERGIVLRVAGPRGLCIQADERLLFEAVSNLVENAIKFSPTGGTIRLCVAGRGDTVDMTVTDEGPGIPVDEHALVLDRFQRGSGSAGAPGSGLGLSLVAAIVALHNFALRLDDAHPGLVARITAPLQRQ